MADIMILILIRNVNQ